MAHGALEGKDMPLRRIRPAAPQQRIFGFVERSRRLRRRFKLAILVVTALVLAAILAASPHGRNLTSDAVDAARGAARWTVGLPTPRSEIDAAAQRHRLLAIDDASRKYRASFQALDEPTKRLYRYGGIDPDHGLLRQGNYDQTLLLPSTSFEADDKGRLYRLKPNVRTVWVRNVLPPLEITPSTFLALPDRPELVEIAREAGGGILPNSVQTTNSWGLRGPEPDLEAPLRGIVLGDSTMQGLYIDDDHAPPECLRRRLKNRFKTEVSVLNTGHLGYSPEQYYYTFVEYLDRFKPQFVVVSLCVNDFGDAAAAMRGEGDWEGGRYWLGEISRICRVRQLVPLFVPAPVDHHMDAPRRAGNYPGKIANIVDVGSEFYLDPIEAFIDRNLAMILKADREGHRPSTSPLYNGHFGDHHFSPEGSEVWAEAVANRLALLLERHRAK